MIPARPALAALAALVLAGCFFSADEMRDLLPETVRDAPALYASRRPFVCALAVFAPTAQDLSAWEARLAAAPEGWQSLPAASKVGETSILYRILGASRRCWDRRVTSALGLGPEDDLSTQPDGAFAIIGGEAVFYFRRTGMFLAMAG